MSEMLFPEGESKTRGSFTLGRVVFFLVLIFFLLSFWLVFYSPKLANEIVIIGLRRAYVQSIWKVRGYFQQPERYFPPFKPPYPITVIGKLQNDMGYIYTFVGKFESIELDRGVLNLRDFNGNPYSFLLPISSVNEDGVMYKFEVVINEPGEPSKKKTLIMNINEVIQDETFAKDVVFSVVWHDPKKLSEIKIVDGSTVNEYATNILNVIRYGQDKNESN